MSNERPRLAALIEYVQQSARGRAKLVSNVSDYGRFLLMEHHLAGLEGVKLNDAGPDGEDEVWLSVPRPPNPEPPPRTESPWLAAWLAVSGPLPEAPRPPPAIEGWALIAAGTHRDTPPPPGSVAEMAQPEVDPNHRVALEDYEFRGEVEKQFVLFRGSVWNLWAEAEQRRRRLSRLYVQLFTLQQELAGAMVQGQLELVWGIGL